MIPLPEIWMAVRWWAVLTAIGAAAVPLAGWLLRPLPDRGYALSKMLGLLLASYFFWLLASLGMVENSAGGLLLGVLGVIGFSFWGYRKLGRETGRWVREHWRYILTVELLFTVLFFVWVWVRAQNPGITATEKPMEFAFLNAATYSPTYPPLDPWLSDYAISYYYFGYVMMSLLGRLAGVAPAYGFNLGIAWLVAGSAVGAFGVVYNLTGLTGRRRPIVWGGLAAVALPLAGNGVMLLDLLRGLGLAGEGLWRWLDIRDLTTPAVGQFRFLTAGGTPNGSWWWWRASRVIHEYYLSGRPEEGLEPIAEFPGFSFLLGDMHPHVLALPFAFLAIAVALSWYLRLSLLESPITVEGWSFVTALWSGNRGPLLLLTVIVVGGLSFLNTWDVLIHLFVLLGAVVLARWGTVGWSNQRLVEGVGLGVVLVAGMFLLYLPFYLGFSSQAGPPFILPMMMRPTRLAHFWVIFGRSLLVLLPFLIIVTQQYARQRRFWSTGIKFAATLVLGLLFIALLFIWGLAASPNGVGFLAGPTADLGLVLPERNSGIDLAWSISFVGQFVPVYLIARGSTIALTLFLMGIIAAVVAAWSGVMNTRPVPAVEEEDEAFATPDPELTGGRVLPFVLLLVFTAALLSIGPEFVYLKDNFGQRLNTIFKFYYQSWILYGTAAFFALDYLWRRAKPVGIVASGLVTVLLAIALVYPIQGVRSRAVEYRGPAGVANRRPATLNGLDFLAVNQAAELEAIEWLRRYTPADAVIVEATGGAYSYFGRFSANSGRPTLLGWANHEFQWRGDSTTAPAERTAVVQEIYNSTDWARTVTLLNQFGVDYIVVGSLEKSEHPRQGLEKFSENLAPVFSNESVAIYAWQSNP